MKKTITILLLILFQNATLYAQSDCSNPAIVDICPAINLIGETNAGMGDDAPAFFNIPGDDVVYDIVAPIGTSNIFISIRNATSFFKMSLVLDSCNGTLISSNFYLAANTNITISVPLANNYYLWIDSPDTISYDISIGGDTGVVAVNIPNTQGNLEFDSSLCALPVFQNTKPFYQVTYNGVYKTNPMTLSPLFVPGTMCISFFFRNTTGVEGIKRIMIDLSGGGYTNIQSADTVPGFYNTGNWIASGSNNRWTFYFADSAGTGRGDFTGSPDTCLKYQFCFDLTPLSNNPQQTNVNVNITSDGFGSGFNGYAHLGCCPQTNLNCSLPGPGNGGSNAHSFAFGIDDPGSTLPIELTQFYTVKNNRSIEIRWVTESEINNDYFTVEKSNDALNWSILTKIKGAGNSTSTKYYNISDDDPFRDITFYRLRQTDYDGTSDLSNIISVRMNELKDVIVYPNPVSSQLTIECGSDELVTPGLFNVLGEKMEASVFKEDRKIFLNTSKLNDGVYFLVLTGSEGETEKKMIIIRK